MQPLVTIAIPTYKRLIYLKEAVASALNQHYEPIEILIGLDPSDEGLDKEIKEWLIKMGSTNPKIKYFFNEKNLGLAGNWNKLASQATGEYMMIIGDDDRLLPDTVEQLTSAIHPGINVVFSNHYLINQDGIRLVEESIEHTNQFNRNALPAGKVTNPAKVIWQNAVPISAALIKSDDVRKLKFKEDLNTPEIEFYLQLAMEGGIFYFVPDYTMEYRVHPGSATHAGLNVHHLIKYLIPIEADHESQKYKTLFIRSLVGSAVNKYLQEGKIKDARFLYFSKFYSFILKVTIRGIIHRMAISLPDRFSKSFFNFVYRFK